MEKIINGYENYSISHDGIVKNIKTGRILKLDLTRRGYLQIELYSNKKSKKFLVHRLVAMYFLDSYDSVKQVNHIDGDRQNNHYLNLEVLSQSENLEDMRSRVKRKGKISKFKIGEIYKEKKWENVDDFFREIMKW